MWLSHSNEWRKPWKLAAQLKEICSRPEDRQGQTDWYHTLSTIKHGSPAKISWLEKFIKTPAESGGVAFSITRDASKVLFDKQNLGHMMGTLLFATGSDIAAGSRAAIEILARRDQRFPEVDSGLTIAARLLDEIFERDCVRKIVQSVRANDPEFDRLCTEVERLKRENNRK